MNERINIRLFSEINKYAGESVLFDNIAIVVSEYLPYVFIAALIYLWFSSKKDGKHSVLFAGYSAVVGILINRFISFSYFHPRPFIENIGISLVNHVPDSSFPSDHTTFMLSIAAMLMFIRPTRKAGSILFFLGLLGGASRVFCGVHYPQDIFGSLLVSLVTASTIWTLRNKLSIINEFAVNLYFRTLCRKKLKSTIKHTLKN